MENTTTLKNVWAEFKQQNPKARIRDAAHTLGVSEAELLATGLGETVIRLEGDFKELLKQVETLGHVMALTRNDHCVHERKGVYKKVSFGNHVGLALGEDIDLRLFMNRWKFAFAVNENERFSLQFFDKNGVAVHKIYLTEKSDKAAYDSLIKAFTAASQNDQLTVESTKKVKPEIPDAEVDVDAFQQEWLALKDTHDFIVLLRKFKLSRTQALRLAPEGYAPALSLSKLKAIFEQASERDLPIMVFTGSSGCIQIHTGLTKRLVQTGEWFNVLDPEFNLHLRETAVHSVYLTKKPTTDGLVHGVEAFDEKGEMILQLFGKRKPGIPEDENWRELVNTIVSDTEVFS